MSCHPIGQVGAVPCSLELYMVSYCIWEVLSCENCCLPGFHSEEALSWFLLTFRASWRSLLLANLLNSRRREIGTQMIWAPRFHILRWTRLRTTESVGDLIKGSISRASMNLNIYFALLPIKLMLLLFELNVSSKIHEENSLTPMWC